MAKLEECNSYESICGWNKYGALPADLLSRFLRIKFDPYDEPAFIKVASTVMVNTENCSSDVANYIAQEV